ncbi:MAG: methyltransferase domain-containing protein [Planctomycetia bacterium]|nr:methyltransferase domain-containing protein [Planctomycetia bacterium]
MAAAAGYITDVAYIPGFYPHMAPVSLRHAAALNRVIPPRSDVPFRYLELGCGLGRSLTTLAAANPQGEFVGVDVNPEHTRQVEGDIAAAGLNNARVITADFAGLPADLGRFEFIALHGVFSWVSEQVRREILALARERLAPGGLLLVSYNSMPGWAHLQPIRGILRQYAQLRQGDSLQKVRDALSYLVFIRDRHARYFEDNPRAAAYVDGLLKQDVRYLAHEYLNEHWTSFYFSEVAGMFGAAGLAFVGSLPVFTNFWDLCVRPEFQELFRTTTNRLVTEAHKDFCANTAFRWDVYCREPRLMTDAADRLAQVDDLRFHVAKPGTTLPYQANLGVVTSTVQGPVYERLVALLGTGSLRMSEIVAAARDVVPQADDVVRAVDAGVAMGLFDVTAGALEPPPGAGGDVSIASAFNRVVLAADALSGRPLALASERTGTGHTIGDFDAAILHELVERGRGGLVERVDARLVAAGRSIQQEGQPVTDPAARRRLVEAACTAFLDASLPQLARLGIVAV